MIATANTPLPDLRSSPIGKYRWTICSLVFFATTINYLDRQVISLLKPTLEKEFSWKESDYSNIVIAFQFAYALGMIGAGRIIDKIGTKLGYAFTLILWSIASILHAFATGALSFMIYRAFLGVTEAGNFPAAFKTVAEWFPRKERAFAGGIFNSGTNIGAIIAPIVVPYIAIHYSWRIAFIAIGAIGFIWLIFWFLLYEVPAKHKKLSKEELDYINSDTAVDDTASPRATANAASLPNGAIPGSAVPHSAVPTGITPVATSTSTTLDPAPLPGDTNADAINIEQQPNISWTSLLRLKQTWAFVAGKFLTDGIWWFFLFWLPAFLASEYKLVGMQVSLPIAFVYSLAGVASVFGGWLPAWLVKNKNWDIVKARKRSMLLYAFFPLLVMVSQTAGSYGMWYAVIIIGIAASAHQAWSANLFTTVSDMFPKSSVASVVGIGGMAGGLGGMAVAKMAGLLFDHYKSLGHIQTGYYILFLYCGLGYLVAWFVMFRLLVPGMEPVTAANLGKHKTKSN